MPKQNEGFWGAEPRLATWQGLPSDAVCSVPDPPPGNVLLHPARHLLGLAPPQEVGGLYSFKFQPQFCFCCPPLRLFFLTRRNPIRGGSQLPLPQRNHGETQSGEGFAGGPCVRPRRCSTTRMPWRSTSRASRRSTSFESPTTLVLRASDFMEQSPSSVSIYACYTCVRCIAVQCKILYDALVHTS